MTFASLQSVSPHHLRHGGASHDALDENTDFSIMGRRLWSSTRYTTRYKKTARFFKCSEGLTPVHLALIRFLLRMLHRKARRLCLATQLVALQETNEKKRKW